MPWLYKYSKKFLEETIRVRGDAGEAETKHDNSNGQITALTSLPSDREVPWNRPRYALSGHPGARSDVPGWQIWPLIGGEPNEQILERERGPRANILAEGRSEGASTGRREVKGAPDG